jgi:hypothetical protein
MNGCRPEGAQSKVDTFSRQSSLGDTGTREDSHQALFADAMTDSPRWFNYQSSAQRRSDENPSSLQRGQGGEVKLRLRPGELEEF